MLAQFAARRREAQERWSRRLPVRSGALLLRTPVVSGSGTRPAGAVTFRPDHAEHPGDRVPNVWRNHEDVRRRLTLPDVRGAVAGEAAFCFRPRIVNAAARRMHVRLDAPLRSGR